jgi:hypothetical protein
MILAQALLLQMINHERMCMGDGLGAFKVLTCEDVHSLETCWTCCCPKRRRILTEKESSELCPGALFEAASWFSWRCCFGED